jgi:eukaryotic-like serine/threonine-protein kinase
VKSERWQQVEQLYHLTLDQTADERADFLVNACAGDEELRREVESLLFYEDRAKDFIESPALDVAAKMLAEERVAIIVGETIEHYQVSAPFGAGEMGEIYLAEMKTRWEGYQREFG